MNSLTFNTIELHPVPQNDGQIWLSSSEIAQVLDYKSADSVTKIFNRNVDEFTDSMTQVIDYSMDGQIDRPKNSIFKTRIFSLRGCHLIAMFARTTIAKQFRKWVLDVLDKEVGQANQTPIPTNPHLALRNTIQAMAKGDRRLYKALYSRLYHQFQVTSYKHIPTQQCASAIEFIKTVQGEYIARDKIGAAKPSLALCDGQHYVVAKDGAVLLHKVLSHDINDSCLKSVGIGQDKFEALKKDLAQFCAPEDVHLEITYMTAQRTLSLLSGLIVTLETHGFNMALMYQKTNFVKNFLTNYHSRLDAIHCQMHSIGHTISMSAIDYASDIGKHPTVATCYGTKIA